jgi:hypothetical protein
MGEAYTILQHAGPTVVSHMYICSLNRVEHVNHFISVTKNI